MNRYTTLAIAVAAALVLMLGAGAGSASATVLCKKAENPCKNTIGANTNIEASLAAGTKVRFRAGFTNIECSSSAIKANLSNPGGEGARAAAAISAESFTSCNKGQTVTVNADGKLEFEYSTVLLGTGKAWLTNLNSITVEEGGTKCTYTETPFEKPIMVNGSATAPSYTMTDSETELVKSGGGLSCAEKAKMNATYNITSPTELFVVEK